MKERFLTAMRRKDVLEALARDREPTNENARNLSFPKGRCKAGESTRAAALREFEEETRISASKLVDVAREPILHAYVGTDGLTYCSVLYVAELRDRSAIRPVTSRQRPSDAFPRPRGLTNESSELVWLSADEAPQHELLDAVNAMIRHEN
jgi:8-oxo-dGTP pyrophosphatase MutT (NUDIX family)